ncbi:MAG TPA: electron transfer flavoprotein subunit alpha/FixB family protein [Actinomycetaceae bacterium]|nr:electron transfer flavoprotein subunit alpha/FixB family protein [Actinomycetaceae bacterium]
MANSWIITTGPDIGALVEAARHVGGTVTVVAVGNGDGYAGVDAVVNIPLADGLPEEAAAPAVAAAVTAANGDAILAANRGADRVLAGAVAARLGAPVFTNVTAYSDGTFTLGRYGGISIEHVESQGPTVVIMDGGAAVEGDAVAATAAEADGAYDVSIAGEETKEFEAVDFNGAKTIVAIGRGFAAEEDLELAREFVDALGGVPLGCTRPLAEGSDWMPKDTYIGVSGAVIAPELYFAVGISGQLHHTVGATGSGTIVVINEDPTAPYFEESDYGIVGDLYEMLPKLTAAIR